MSPTTYPVNDIGEGERESAAGKEPAFTPVPARETVCDPVERLMVSVPVAVPTVVGVKVTVTVQDLPARIVAVHVEVSAKLPVADAPVYETEVVPVFVIVTFCPALLTLSTCGGKRIAAGDTVTTCAVVLPAPVRFTF